MDCSVTVRAPASIDDVWSRWTHVAGWPEWNPACTEAEITPGYQEGARMRLKLVHPRGREFYTSPHVATLEPFTHTTWVVRSLGFRSDIVTTMEEEPGGTRVTVTTDTHGPLGFTYRLVMRPKTQAAIYTQMLNALAESFDE